MTQAQQFAGVRPPRQFGVRNAARDGRGIVLNATLVVEDFELAMAERAPGHRITIFAIRLVSLAIFVGVAGPAMVKFIAAVPQALERHGPQLFSQPLIQLLLTVGIGLTCLTVWTVYGLLRQLVSGVSRGPSDAAANERMAAAGLLGTRTYALTDDGLTITKPNCASWYHWSVFRTWKETPRAIRLSIFKDSIVFLPKSAMQSQKMLDSVIAKAREVIQARNAPPARSPAVATRLADPRISVSGKVTRRDVMSLVDWNVRRQMVPGLRHLMIVYEHPIGALLSAYFCGLSGLIWLARLADDLASGELEWSDLTRVHAFGALFALMLVVGTFFNLLRTVRRITGLALGEKIGIRDVTWGDTTIAVGTDGVSKSTTLIAIKEDWPSFTTLDEANLAYVLQRKSGGHPILIPKRFFASPTDRAEFENYVTLRLAQAT